MAQAVPEIKHILEFWRRENVELRPRVDYTHADKVQTAAVRGIAYYHSRESRHLQNTAEESCWGYASTTSTKCSQRGGLGRAWQLAKLASSSRPFRRRLTFFGCAYVNLNARPPCSQNLSWPSSLCVAVSSVYFWLYSRLRVTVGICSKNPGRFAAFCKWHGFAGQSYKAFRGQSSDS